MLIKNEACVCANCHKARLKKCRADDIEAERREMKWDAWTSVADRRTW
jgi:hypothetical protein